MPKIKRGPLIFWKWYMQRQSGLRYLDPTLPLQPYLYPFLPHKSEVEIADLGSGAVTFLGYKHPSIEVYVYPSDILAFEYADLLHHMRLTPVVPVAYQDMTKLTYPDNTFDIVHCSNALDHCADPVSAIREAIRVCRSGGWVYLRHKLNEATHMNFTGQHRWNIDQSGSLTDRDGKVSPIAHFCFHTSVVPNPKRGKPKLVVSTLRKGFA